MLLTFFLLAQPTGIYAQTDRMESAPDEIEGVGITEYLGEQVPLDVELIDSEGNRVTLGELIKGDKPVILSLVYYTCPMLCVLILNGLVDGLQGMEKKPGTDFDILTVSFDTRETENSSKYAREKYIEMYGDTSIGDGWRFFTGDQENIDKLTSAVGFDYKFDEASGQYIHAACLFVLSKDGKLMRYLYGVEFPPDTLRMALMEADRDKIGFSQRFLLFCFHYDASTGKYAPVAFNIMRVAGGMTLFVMILFLGVLWARKPRKNVSESTETDKSE